MTRTALAGAMLLALAGCGPSRSELEHDAEIKALIEGWAMACLAAPDYRHSHSEAEAEESLQSCFYGYYDLWKNPDTRIEAEVFA